MPTYSYACSACSHRFDAVQSIHDDALSTCPECAGSVRRVISASAVTFRGSGFYRTDSRSSGGSAAGAGAAGSGTSTASGATASPSSSSSSSGASSAASS